MKSVLVLAVLTVFFASSVCAFAGDVWVNPYYRSDGTYVRGHYRSSPDGIKSNNYGPSGNSWELTNPRSRDYDGDGTPNYLDSDSDNDGFSDDYDANPYSRDRW